MKHQNNSLGDIKQLWGHRARYYNCLSWAKDKGYLECFVHAGNFKSDDTVLDVGTGTGIVAHALKNLVKNIIGIDISGAMLKLASNRNRKNIVFKYGDITKPDFPDGYFDKVTARMVFHHLGPQTHSAARQCYRLLKHGGSMILSEGVPPHYSLKDWYTRMFALKEKRLTFFKKDLVDILKKSGFHAVKTIEHTSPQMSIKNWLKNSAIPRKNQEKIFKMHLGLDARGKKMYNMTAAGDDVLVDFKYVIVVGEKR
jgi:ubiquinone/menaquinone biosynthesis C-methylase UbiE